MIDVLQDLYLDDYFEQITMGNNILNYQKNNITSFQKKNNNITTLQVFHQKEYYMLTLALLVATRKKKYCLLKELH